MFENNLFWGKQPCDFVVRNIVRGTKKKALKSIDTRTVTYIFIESVVVPVLSPKRLKLTRLFELNFLVP